ncbi:MAG: acyl-CoA dehydrogenase family protein [Acidimicrobiia bacterium]
MAIDLTFNEEQEMLREMVRGVCAEYASPESVRAMEDDPIGYTPEFWQQLGDLDLIGLLVPIAYGGSGMSALEGAVVYEEFGRALAPSPHFVSTALAAAALDHAGSVQQAGGLLPQVVSGKLILTTAWLEPERGFGPKGIALTATADGDGFVLNGTKWHVPFAAAAHKLLVLARTGDGDQDIDLFLVDRDAAGVSLEQYKTIASDTQYAVTFDGVRVAATDRVGEAGSGWATWSEVMLDGMIYMAAQAVGGAKYALEITVQYAKDRVQFDKPLGAFQAISHYLADASTAVDGAEILVHEAAWARANGKSVERLAPMAKLFACNTFRDVTAMAQQVFGGVGFTLEYDIQLYFRRAKELQISWMDTRSLEDMVAAAILD